MINRIRVVTLLVMVLGVFALLQLISGSLFFSSLHHSQKSFVVSNQLREQQGELTSTWDLMLQTRINLSRSAVRMMMDSSISKVMPKLNCSIAPGKHWPRPRLIIKNSKAWHRYLKWSLPVVILMKNIKTITQR